MRHLLKYILISLVAIFGSSSAVLIPDNAVEVVQDTTMITAHQSDALPVYVPYLDGSSILPDSGGGTLEGRARLEKRSFYTCFNRATTSVSPTDCAAVITRLRANASQPLRVSTGLCLVWAHGTCQSRLCAENGVRTLAPHSGTGASLNRTAGDVADELEGTLLERCVRAAGLDGVAGDCANMNSGCGTYRLTLEHRAGGPG